MSVRETIHSTHWARWVLSILAVLSLGACVPQYSQHDWAGLVSKTDALRFIAPASCDTPDVFDAVAADAAFFKVNRLEPVRGEPWTYNIEFVENEGVRRGRFVIKQWWSGAGTKAAPGSVTTDNKFCNVLAEVPLSRDGRNPYYVEAEAAKTAEYNSLTPFTPLSVLLLVLADIALLLSFWGFEHAELWFKWAGVLVALFVASAAVYFFCVEAPWHEYQNALTYLKYFEQLPRTASGDLLPISPQQLAYIVAGPTHPQSTQFHFEVFAWVSGGLIGLWLVITCPFVVMGVYWLAVPLPLEELHQRTLRAGRAPTAAEITAAVLSACTGKAAWQHRIMQRKADAFAKNLNNIAQHL
jgi:hypothetical protein